MPEAIDTCDSKLVDGSSLEAARSVTISESRLALAGWNHTDFSQSTDPLSLNQTCQGNNAITGLTVSRTRSSRRQRVGSELVQDCEDVCQNATADLLASENNASWTSEPLSALSKSLRTGWEHQRHGAEMLFADRSHLTLQEANLHGELQELRIFEYHYSDRNLMAGSRHRVIHEGRDAVSEQLISHTCRQGLSTPSA